MADCYFYLPGLGIFVIVVWAAADLAARFRFNLRWVAALAIMALSVLTWRQIGVWSNSYELWTHALRVTKDNAVAEVCLGNDLFSRTYDAPSQRYPNEDLERGRAEGLRHLRHGVRLDPQASARLDLARALGQRGEFREATEQYQAMNDRTAGN